MEYLRSRGMHEEIRICAEGAVKEDLYRAARAAAMEANTAVPEKLYIVDGNELRPICRQYIILSNK